MRGSIQFLGAAGTVTGSMHLVSNGDRRLLLDCGLFQGLKNLRQRNWAPRVPDPKSIDVVVLSHGHIDHTGYLPLLAKQGFRGPVYCTPATADLLRVVLPDAARLQEEEAEQANRRHSSKHQPALPLYTEEDAQQVLRQVQSRPCGEPFPIPGIGTVHYRHAGHILGSATVDLKLDESGARLVFSGDLGRYDRPILLDPEPVPEADVLLLESTYGNRVHSPGAEGELAAAVRDTATRGGALLIPAFAVDRTQELLWMLHRLEAANQIPVLPVYCDSPMGIEATDIYKRHAEEFDQEMIKAISAGDQPLTTRQLHLARTTDDSKKINDVRGPVIIMSSSGMASGGRILHHLEHRVSDPTTTVLLVGYQAAGTRGRALQDGAKTLKIFGTEVPVRAKVVEISGLSAHADRDETLRWLGGFTRPPRHTYLVHGEPEGAEGLAAAMRTKLGWDVTVAADAATVPLGDSA